MAESYPKDYEYCKIFTVQYYTNSTSKNAQNIAARSFDDAVAMVRRVQGEDTHIISVTELDQFAWWNLEDTK